jgi:hypothetical protein
MKSLEPGWLWRKFRGSWLWQALRPNPVLRSAVYFAVELRKSFSEDDKCGVDAIDKHFLKSIDPWDYETSPMEQDRFARQTDARAKCVARSQNASISFSQPGPNLGIAKKGAQV